jgi:hypothetical protein
MILLDHNFHRTTPAIPHNRLRMLATHHRIFLAIDKQDVAVQFFQGRFQVNRKGVYFAGFEIFLERLHDDLQHELRDE